MAAGLSGSRPGQASKAVWCGSDFCLRPETVTSPIVCWLPAGAESVQERLRSHCKWVLRPSCAESGRGAERRRGGRAFIILFVSCSHEMKPPIIVLRSPSTAYRSHSAAQGATTLSSCCHRQLSTKQYFRFTLVADFPFLGRSALVQSVKSRQRWIFGQSPNMLCDQPSVFMFESGGRAGRRADPVIQ